MNRTGCALPLLVLGALATLDLFLPGPSPMGWLIALGPALLAGGVALLLPRPRLLLAVGLVLLAVGGWPWLYTPALTGDRPGGEGAGMLGTILFMLVGLPGAAVTLVGLLEVLHGRSRSPPPTRNRTTPS